MIRPPALKKGDRIRLVAPARKISTEELEPALQQIRNWGFKACYSNRLFAEENQFAGSDDIRIADFQEALDDPKCAAILCVRGGYGSVRLIDHLNFDQFRIKPKWIVGYSDITVFHSALHQLGYSSLHATMPINFMGNTPQSLSSLFAALKGEDYEIAAQAHPFNNLGSCEAPIVGGNLSMLYSLLGSAQSINCSGKILFLEDLDEYLYHIDRMMYNLKRNDYLSNLAGIIVGSMADMNDNRIPFGETAEEILRRHFEDLNIPIAFGLPAGHLNDNQTLILGLKAQLQIDSQKTTIRFPHESKSKAG